MKLPKDKKCPAIALDLSAMHNCGQLYGVIPGDYAARRVPSGAAKHVEAPRNTLSIKTGIKQNG